MKKIVWMLVWLSATLPSWAQTAEEGDQIAKQAYEAVGGAQKWDKIRYIRFDWAPERGGVKGNAVRHLWDRWTGAYRAEWKKNADTTYLALFNVNDKKGKVFVNQQLLPDLEAAPLLTRAYGRFINDSYWLLVPTKFFDAGVSRAAVPDSSTATHRVFRIWFDNVGLTPKDQYWFWVQKDTGRIDRWAFILQSNKDGKPTYFDWKEWANVETPVGLVYLPKRKENPANKNAILTHAAFPAIVPEGAFSDPKWVWSEVD